MAAAQTAADQGVRIYTVGIGSAAGTTVDLNGFQVFTQLDQATLQQISQMTGGTYYGATDAQQLALDLRQPRHPARHPASDDGDHVAVRRR